MLRGYSGNYCRYFYKPYLFYYSTRRFNKINFKFKHSTKFFKGLSNEKSHFTIFARHSDSVFLISGIKTKRSINSFETETYIQEIRFNFNIIVWRSYFIRIMYLDISGNLFMAGSNITLRIINTRLFAFSVFKFSDFIIN